MRFEFYNRPNNDIDIDLYYCGYEDCCDNFSFGPTTRNEYLIHYVVKGSGFLSINDEVYNINANDYFIISPNQIARYWSNDKPSWSFCWLAFNGDKAIEYLRKIHQSHYSPSGNLSKNAIMEIKTKIDKMGDLLQLENEGYKSGLLSGLYSIISIMEGDRKKFDIKKKGINEYVEKAIIFIENSYNKKISVKDVVDYVKLDRSYFSKIFKKSTGISPQEYLQDFRINKSIELMLSTNLKFSELCKCVGIEEEYYFWRLFKKHTGYSPTEYLKESAKSTAI